MTVVCASALLLPAARASAAPAATPPTSTSTPAASTVPTCDKGQTGSTDTPCAGLPITPTQDPAAGSNCSNDCGLVAKYGIPLINFAAGLVGIAATISIVIGGIQYSASGDNPQATSAAKKRIANAVLALLGFLFLYAALQWILPGGFL